MNIKLSVYSNRLRGKSGYAVYTDKGLVEVRVSGTESSNIKGDVLITLAKGLRACRKYAGHSDILYIEIQNQHLCNWLEGCVEYKGYSSFLDDAFEALESLDCRYRFVFVKNPVAKRLVDEGSSQIKGMSLSEAFSDLI